MNATGPDDDLPDDNSPEACADDEMDFDDLYGTPKADEPKAGANVDDSHNEKTDVATDGATVATSGKTKSKRKLRAVSVATDPDANWFDRLSRTNTGLIKRTIANAVSILGHHEQWQGVLAYNEFESKIIFQKRPKWYADDDDGKPCTLLDTTNTWRLQLWFQREHDLDLTDGQCYASALIVSKKNAFHPIQDRLRRLQWDGKPRIERYLIRHAGAPDTPYVRMVSRFFLVSAVARAMVPGCKVDTMLILEGPQGFKKSTFFRVLFGDWFTDAPIDWNSKDRFEVLRGKWCVEMAELDGMQRADVSRIKAFLATQEDRYRRPYAKEAEDAQRQCVFVGTVNPNALGTYLRDDENRRFWPVKCTKYADLTALAAERDQLFAEALLHYQHENEDMRRWWPETEKEKQLCAEQVETRVLGDSWQGYVDEYLAKPTRNEVTVAEVLKDAIGFDKPKMDIGSSVRVATCLKAAGWIRDENRPRNGKNRDTVYKRPSPPTGETQAQAQATEATQATQAGETEQAQASETEATEADEVPPFSDYSHIGH